MKRAAPAAALLLLGGAVHFLPEHLATAGVGNQKAIEVVAYGFDATVAWLLVALLLRGKPAWPVALWLAFESLMRGGCRLALPLNVPPPKDTHMCSAAFGTSVPAWVGLILAALCAAYVWGLRANTTN